MVAPWNVFKVHRRLTELRRKGVAAELGIIASERSEHVPDDSQDDSVGVRRSLNKQDLEPVIARLQGEGYSVYDMAAAIYSQLEGDDHPSFLQHIHLDEFGGLRRVRDMWFPLRIFWFLVLLWSLLFNVALLLYINWPIMNCLITVVQLDMAKHRNAEIAKDFDALSEKAIHQVFRRVDDPETQKQFFRMSAAIGICEIVGVLYYCVLIIYNIFAFVGGTVEFNAFNAIIRAFQHYMPRLASFSALKMMNAVHPSLIYKEFADAVHETPCRWTTTGVVATAIWFVITRLLCWSLAVCAFAVKILEVALTLMDPNKHVVMRWASIVALMNNCAGCILMDEVQKNRLFLFVYGGNDAEYQDDERALYKAYLCRLMKQLWTEFKSTGERFKAIVICCTLDHYDVQWLLVGKND